MFHVDTILTVCKSDLAIKSMGYSYPKGLVARLLSAGELTTQQGSNYG
jgi:hypothetical protein